MALASRRIRLSTIAIVASAGLVAACSAQPAAQTTSPESTPATAEVAVHPTSGLAIIPLQVTDGHDTHSFRVELAATVGAQAKGMMFRTEMAPDEGMLFPSRTVEVRGFWMKNTPLPLDIIFIGADGRIINIAENTVPYSLETVYSEGPAGAVLELAGGRAAELGIKPGDMVEYSLPE